jgi:N-sulfoglucosamine sulfohydrolase
MKHFSLFLACTAACGIYSLEASAANNKKKERPNILWVTFEDTSSYEFGCYGNKDVHTPNADSLAAQGIQFMNAWSVAPQSSPARSSLITGCYAPTYGMDVHPVSYDTPADIFFPQRLREAGYYCTNNSKTHYNSTNNNKACWDECTKTASYNSPKRGKDQPFFAVFNTVTSHMGRVRTFHTDGRRDYTKEGIYTELLTLPSYVPDLPEVRSDYAGHLEAVQDVDTWLGFFLKDLKDKGLDDNTIIFFFSDHGGCVPRGKGYLYESGLKVPLIAYFPEKWKHLANGKSGKDNSLVNFTDLGPTVLSLAGVKPTKNMQGKAIFGEYASKEERKVQFAFAANQLHHFMPVRAVTDGHIKYMRSYIPYRQFALRNYYQWGMPSNKAWDKLVLGNHNTNPDWALTFDAHPAEMLFDLDKDPGELHDLSSSPEYAEVLAKMRNELSNHIRSTHDLGFFLPTSRTGHVLYDVVRKEKYPMEELYKLVEAAGIGDIASLPLFEKAIASSHRDMRFWGAVGYAELAHKKQISQCPQALADLLKDEDPYVASEAAYAAAYLGKPQEGIARLINPAKEEDRKIGYSSLECISLDPTMRDYIRQFLPQLKEAAETLPRKKNEDSGLMARGILVNLGELDIKLLHGPEAYKEGLKLNHGRRPMVPLPY